MLNKIYAEYRGVAQCCYASAIEERQKLNKNLTLFRSYKAKFMFKDLKEKIWKRLMVKNEVLDLINILLICCSSVTG